MSKEAIIKNIAATAAASAADIAADAATKRDEILSSAKRDSEAKLAEAKAVAEQNSALNRARQAKIAELDARKITLTAKRRVIDAAYALAEKKLIALPDKEYARFMGVLVNRYAEEGDTVIVSPRDAARLNEAWLKSCCKTPGLKLAVSDVDFSGGLMLSNSVCDKNLTAEMLVSEARVRTERKVAEMTEE